jgi:hypothetical protein
MANKIFGGTREESLTGHTYETKIGERQSYEDKHGYGSSDAKQPEDIKTCDSCLGEIAAKAWCESGTGTEVGLIYELCSDCLAEMDEQGRLIKVIERNNQQQLTAQQQAKLAMMKGR